MPIITIWGLVFLFAFSSFRDISALGIIFAAYLKYQVFGSCHRTSCSLRLDDKNAKISSRSALISSGYRLKSSKIWF